MPTMDPEQYSRVMEGAREDVVATRRGLNVGTRPTCSSNPAPARAAPGPCIDDFYPRQRRVGRKVGHSP
jgi:hypothetical protein